MCHNIIRSFTCKAFVMVVWVNAAGKIIIYTCQARQFWRERAIPRLSYWRVAAVAHPENPKRGAFNDSACWVNQANNHYWQTAYDDSSSVKQRCHANHVAHGLVPIIKCESFVFTSMEMDFLSLILWTSKVFSTGFQERYKIQNTCYSQFGSD